MAFVVQGEGRGHMTQALAVARFLRDAGHEVATVFVGTSPFRSLPDYFRREIDAPVQTFDAPTQVPDRAARGVSVGSTVVDAIRRLPRFIAAGSRIHGATRRADVLVNFHDLVAGLSRVVFRTDVPAVAVAHNYLFLHPRLSGVPGPARIHRAVMGYTRATAVRARTRVALSYGPLPGPELARLVVSPPLLRPRLDVAASRDDGYLLAYALNPGYGSVLALWHRRNPDVEIHCYLDGGVGALGTEPAEGFHVHSLDDDGFLNHLEGCRAYLGTAGFESICEAFYLGKPVLAVPTTGQHEQTLNAWDAERVGAAQIGAYDDLDGFWSAPPAPAAESVRRFRAWVARAPEVMVSAVERAARVREA